MKKEKLTEKQKLFCLEYLKSFNATDAYKKIYGVSDKTANKAGPRLLVKDGIQEFLGSKAEKKVEKLDVGVDYVLKNLQEIVEIGMGRKEIELKGNKQKIYDLKNVNSALEKLGKYHKMYIDKVEQDATIQIKVVSYKDNEEWQK